MALIIGLEVCVIFFAIMRRTMPVETFQGLMCVRARIMVVVWLALYLFDELAVLNLQLACLVLLAFGFALTPSVRSRFTCADDESPRHPFPFLASPASRAPPVF